MSFVECLQKPHAPIEPFWGIHKSTHAAERGALVTDGAVSGFSAVSVVSAAKLFQTRNSSKTLVIARVPGTRAPELSGFPTHRG